MRGWFAKLGAKTLYIEPGSPWENGYCESFNGKLRDECLNGEIFYSLKEAKVVIQQWRKHYNTIRPHSSLNYRPPAPQTCPRSASGSDHSNAIVSIPLVQNIRQVTAMVILSRGPGTKVLVHPNPPHELLGRFMLSYTNSNRPAKMSAISIRLPLIAANGAARLSFFTWKMSAICDFLFLQPQRFLRLAVVPATPLRH